MPSSSAAVEAELLVLLREVRSEELLMLMMATRPPRRWADALLPLSLSLATRAEGVDSVVLLNLAKWSEGVDSLVLLSLATRAEGVDSLVLLRLATRA